jgi:hypothetical protein
MADNNLGNNLGSEFLRKNTVDLKRYLPEFLSADETISDLSAVESEEHERARLAIQDLFNNLFIETSTWALAKWEELLELTPATTDTYEQRRNRILLRLQSNQTSTPDYIVNLARRYMSADSEVSLVEDNENYKFRLVNRSGSILYSADLLNALDTYKPAHLQYGITLERDIELDDNEKIRTGIINTSAGIKHIDLPDVPEPPINATAGVVMMRAGVQHMTINQPEGWHNTTYVGVYRHKTGKITIGGIR